MNSPEIVLPTINQPVKFVVDGSEMSGRYIRLDDSIPMCSDEDCECQYITWKSDDGDYFDTYEIEMWCPVI